MSEYQPKSVKFVKWMAVQMKKNVESWGIPWNDRQRRRFISLWYSAAAQEARR